MQWRILGQPGGAAYHVHRGGPGGVAAMRLTFDLARWVCCGVAVFCIAPALAQRPAESGSPAAVELPTERIELIRLVDDALLQMRDRRNEATALATLDAIADGPAIGRLDTARQRQVLTSTSFAATVAGEHARAYALIRRVTALDTVTPADWSARFYYALEAGETVDAFASLTRVAEQWPEQMRRVPVNLIYRALQREARNLPNTDAELRLLTALFEIQWRDRYRGEPSELWRQMALLLLERGDVARAREALARVTDPASVVRARADRRFDAMRAAEPALFDVAAAAARELERARNQAESLRDLIEPTLVLIGALDANNRCEEALEVTERAIERAAGPDAEKDPYRDGGRYFVWLLDWRASLFGCLGRWDEALRQRVQAAVLTESGSPNTSQVINLAGLYGRLGRPADALDAIERVGRRSEYGGMQEQSVRLRAYVQLGDADGVRSALDFMSEHREDALATYQSALLIAGDVDAAAAVLIQRLDDERDRADALYGMQDFADRPRPPFEEEGSGRWSELMERDDVSAAIERVGRIESYPFLR